MSEARAGTVPLLRHEQLLKLLAERNTASVSVLAEALCVTTQTIRRDLDLLSRQGKLLKVHGAAIALRAVKGVSGYEKRRAEFASLYSHIAERAVAEIKPGMVLFVDVATTVHSVIDAIAREWGSLDGLAIITNNLHVAHMVGMHEGCDLYVPGGRVHTGELSVYGAEACAYLRSFHADLALIGTHGIQNSEGPTDIRIEDAEIRRVMIEHAKRTLVVADSRKFSFDGLVTVCPFEAIDSLITDKQPPKPLTNRLREAKVKVMVAK